MILLKNDINFISKNNTFTGNRLRKSFIKILPILGVALIITLIHLWSVNAIENLKQESREIDYKTKLLEERIEVIDQDRIDKASLQEKAPPRSEVIEQIYEERNVVTPMMNDILKYIPEDVYITSIRISEQNQMNVDFIVPSTIHALRLVFSFNNSGLYEEIALPDLMLGQSRRTISLNLRLRS